MLSRAECRPGLASVSATCGGPGSAGSEAGRTGDGADRCSPIGAGPTSGTRPPGGFGRDSGPADAAAPETSGLGPSEPGAGVPEPGGPGAGAPGLSGPGAIEPEASGAEASAPEASGPEASGPGASAPGAGVSAGSGPAAGRSRAGGPPARGGGHTAVPGGSRSTGGTGSSAPEGARSTSGGVTGRDTPGSVFPGRRRGPVGRAGASADSSGAGSQPPTRIPVRAMSSSATDPPRPPAASGPAPWLAVGRMTQNAILQKASALAIPTHPTPPTRLRTRSWKIQVPIGAISFQDLPRPGAPTLVNLLIMRLAGTFRARNAVNFMIDGSGRGVGRPGGGMVGGVSGGCGGAGPGWGASSRSAGGRAGRRSG